MTCDCQTYSIISDCVIITGVCNPLLQERLSSDTKKPPFNLLQQTNLQIRFTRSVSPILAFAMNISFSFMYLHVQTTLW